MKKSSQQQSSSPSSGQAATRCTICLVLILAFGRAVEYDLMSPHRCPFSLKYILEGRKVGCIKCTEIPYREMFVNLWLENNSVVVADNLVLRIELTNPEWWLHPHNEGTTRYGMTPFGGTDKHLIGPLPRLRESGMASSYSWTNASTLANISSTKIEVLRHLYLCSYEVLLYFYYQNHHSLGS